MTRKQKAYFLGFGLLFSEIKPTVFELTSLILTNIVEARIDYRNLS